MCAINEDKVDRSQFQQFTLAMSHLMPPPEDFTHKTGEYYILVQYQKLIYGRDIQKIQPIVKLP